MCCTILKLYGGSQIQQPIMMMKSLQSKYLLTYFMLFSYFIEFFFIYFRCFYAKNSLDQNCRLQLFSTFSMLGEGTQIYCQFVKHYYIGMQGSVWCRNCSWWKKAQYCTPLKILKKQLKNGGGFIHFNQTCCICYHPIFCPCYYSVYQNILQCL